MSLRRRWAMDPTGHDVTLDFRKPDLDLIQPGGISRREVKPHLGVLGEDLLDGLCFMGRQIVEHDVNFARPLGLSHQLCQERDELGAGVPLGRFPFTLPVFTFNAAYSDSVPRR